MEVCITECDREQRKLTLSPRLAAFQRLSQHLMVGQLVRGVVRHVAAWGALVELDGCHGLRGLLHKGNLSVEEVEDAAVSGGGKVWRKCTSSEW